MTFDVTIIGFITVLALVAAGLYYWREKRLHKNFIQDVDLHLSTHFYDDAISHDQYQRGSVSVELGTAKQTLQSLTITSMLFNNTAFQIPSMDKLYFKAQEGRVQTLSLSFRVKKQYLRRMRTPRSVNVFIKGIYCDAKGHERRFKGKFSQQIASLPPVSDKGLAFGS